MGMPAFAMTTGSRGLHVVTPLDRSADFDETHDFAKDLAQLLADRHPDTLTTEMRKAEREGRLFLDYVRNGYGATRGCAVFGAPAARSAGRNPADLGRAEGPGFAVEQLQHSEHLGPAGQGHGPLAGDDAQCKRAEGTAGQAG